MKTLKYIFALTLFIINSAPLIGQKSDQHITIKRGDYKEFIFRHTGNVGSSDITFVVKLTKSFSSPRLIQKANNDTTEISAIYSSPYTYIRVKLLQRDTRDFTASKYFYDIVADSTTIFDGELRVNPDVQTPFDGATPPTSGTRFYVAGTFIDSTVADGSVFTWDSTNRTLSTISLDSLGSLIGSGELPDSVVYDSQISAMATTNTTQTITGQKTFSGTKTVFSGDSIVIDKSGFEIRLRGSGSTVIQNGTFDNNINGWYALYGNDSTKWVASGGGFTGAIMCFSLGGFLSFRCDTLYLASGTYQLKADIYLDSPTSLYASALVNAETMTPYNYESKSLPSGSYSINASVAIPAGVYYITVFAMADGENRLYGDNVELKIVPKIQFVDDAVSIGAKDININGNLIVRGDTLTTNISNPQNLQYLQYVSGAWKNVDAIVSSNTDSLGGLSWNDYVTKAGIDGWSTNLYNGSANVMRLGKSYADRRFNNGTYTDVWIIDYVVPPYCLSANWLFPHEQRTDYYNDTIKTMSNVANILNLDGTGTPLWFNNSVTISGNEIQMNLGDLPDSSALNWNNAYLSGSRVILSESNLTATPKRFPMPVKGYEFKFGTNDYYTYPKAYSFYSDLTTNSPNLELAYHFYGQGDFPSYFGGNILTDGYLKVQDSIIIGNSTVKIYPDSITVGGTRVAKITDGQSIIGTTATLDSLITDYWNDNLGGGSSWDSTYAYQKITSLENNVSALQDSVTSFRNILNSILTALDTCGCGVVVTDNTPPNPPTSFTAIGGTSQTQYVSTWTDPVAGDLDSIRFYEGTSNDTTALVWVTSIAKGVETYTRTGRTANTTYWAGVKAVDDSGNVSWFSNLDSAKTLASGSPPDTGFYKFDAEDGLANLVLENGGFITDTSGFAHTGTHSYKFRGNGTTAPVYADIYPFPSGYGDEATIWVSYYVYIPSSTTTNVTSGNYQYLTLFGDNADVNGDAGWLGISTDASGNIDNWVKPWGTELSTGFATDTWLKVEHKYVRGTGANGQDSIWVNGTLIYGTSNATGTITTSRFRFGYPGGNSWRPLSGEAIYFDDIILKRTRVQ